MNLCVCMITYNHEDFIREAIESVLKQETNFPFRLVIGEDAGTDNTRDICEEMALKHPGKILLLPYQQNLGMMKNFLRTYNKCDGDYIAFLEGDDYWTDNKKLQKQVSKRVQTTGLKYLLFQNCPFEDPYEASILYFRCSFPF